MNSTGCRILLLFTAVYGNGGIQRFNRTLLAACAELGVHATVLSMLDDAGSIQKGAPPAGITVLGFGGSRIRFAAAIARASWFGRFDHIIIGHVHLLRLAVGLLRARAGRRPSVMLIAHGIEVWKGIGPSKARALARLTRILCVSRYTLRRIREQAPALPAELLSVFPNALADTWTRTRQDTTPQDLPQRFILSVTRLDPGDRYKGIVTTLEALSMVSDPALHYLVVGQGDDLPFLQEVAHRCGLSERVHFRHGLGDEELIELYRRCLAFVLPSGKEGFGIVFLEAMFFGAPVLAAAERGALDVIRDGETGLLVRYGDSAALHGALEKIAADPELRERLRTQGRADVTGSGPFTFSSFRERWRRILDDEVRAA